jgi:hypothetical protein
MLIDHDVYWLMYVRNDLCMSQCLKLTAERDDVQAGKTRRVQINAEKRKEKNRITHSAPGTVKVKAARKKKIVAEVE